MLVGSADKVNKRNPIPIKVRIKLLETALEDEGLLSRCIIQPLNDLTDESDNSQDWGFYLYANIVSIIKESHLISTIAMDTKLLQHGFQSLC